MTLKIAHISDPHFSKITFNPLQFFSKRWVGNANLLLNRQKRYKTQKMASLPSIFDELETNYVLITGDLTTTSRNKEFELAKNCLSKISQKRLIIPGNHDIYTKKASRENTFYKFFENEELKKTKVSSLKLDDNWWYIGLDTALPSPLFSCFGLFSKMVEENLKKALENVPSHYNVLLANHFPLNLHKKESKSLKRRNKLKKILQENPQVKIYLHGHTHENKMINMQNQNLPLVICSGCCSHVDIGAWNFLELSKTNCTIHTYEWKKTSWQKEKENKIDLT